MAIFRSVFLSLVLLPFCSVHCGDPLTWASIEAQGAYIIGEGKKCSAIPNTFEMRADGAWLPASEYDLTGNFDDDCGITVTLSIPSESSGPDPIKESLENETQEIKKQEAGLVEDMEELEGRRKKLEEEEKEHREKLEEAEEENKEADKKRKEVEAKEKSVKEKKEGLEKREGEVKERRENLEGRRKSLKKRKEGLEKRKEGQEKRAKQHQKAEERLEKDKEEFEAKKEDVRKLYGSCKEVETDTTFVIPSEVLQGTDKKICLLME